MGRKDGGRTAHRTGGVHTEDRLACRTKRVGQVELRRHHPFEEVGRLAHHDRIDLVEGHARIFERTQRRLANKPRHREVAPLGGMVRLPNAQYSTALLHG